MSFDPLVARQAIRCSLKAAGRIEHGTEYLFNKHAQLGHTQAKMDRLFEQLRDDSLFYPDPDLAREKAESHRRCYTINTALSPERVDRYINWLFYQFSAPRERNLNPCQLALAVSLIIKSM